MTDLDTYYTNLIKQIDDNKMKSFWLLCNIKEFNPIKKDTGQKDKLKKYIKTRKDLWNQLLAGIDLLYGVKPEKINNSNNNTEILNIKIYIYKINNKGEFDINASDTWSLNVYYTKTEIDTKRPSYEKLIDNIKMMIKIVEKKKILSDLFGISYTQFIEAYNKLKKNKRSVKKRSIKKKLSKRTNLK